MGRLITLVVDDFADVVSFCDFMSIKKAVVSVAKYMPDLFDRMDDVKLVIRDTYELYPSDIVNYLYDSNNVIIGNDAFRLPIVYCNYAAIRRAMLISEVLLKGEEVNVMYMCSKKIARYNDGNVDTGIMRESDYVYVAENGKFIELKNRCN